MAERFRGNSLCSASLLNANLNYWISRTIGPTIKTDTPVEWSKNVATSHWCRARNRENFGSETKKKRFSPPRSVSAARPAAARLRTRRHSRHHGAVVVERAVAVFTYFPTGRRAPVAHPQPTSTSCDRVPSTTPWPPPRDDDGTATGDDPARAPRRRPNRSGFVRARNAQRFRSRRGPARRVSIVRRRPTGTAGETVHAQGTRPGRVTGSRSLVPSPPSSYTRRHPTPFFFFFSTTSSSSSFVFFFSPYSSSSAEGLRGTVLTSCGRASLRNRSCTHAKTTAAPLDECTGRLFKRDDE